MANIGSAFLGDLQAKRIHHLSFPPSSPPTTTLEHMNVSLPPSRSQWDEQLGKACAALAQPPYKTTIDPILALELRVRWLEALVLGVPGPELSSASVNADKSKSRADDKKGQKDRGNAGSLSGVGPEKYKGKARDGGKRVQSSDTLAQLTEKVTKRLNAIVETNEGLRKFMDTCASSITLPCRYDT